MRNPFWKPKPEASSTLESTDPFQVSRWMVSAVLKGSPWLEAKWAFASLKPMLARHTQKLSMHYFANGVASVTIKLKLKRVSTEIFLLPKTI